MDPFSFFSPSSPFPAPSALDPLDSATALKLAISLNVPDKMAQELARLSQVEPLGPSLLFAALRMSLGCVSQDQEDPSCAIIALEAGANPDGLDGPPDDVASDMPPLAIALSSGRVKMAQALLERGANPNWLRLGACPLSLLAGFSCASAQTARLLLDFGARPDGGASKSGANDNPLILCARYNKPDMAAELIRAGANPRLTDPYGRDALTMATQLNHHETRLAIASEIERRALDQSSRSASPPATPRAPRCL